MQNGKENSGLGEKASGGNPNSMIASAASADAWSSPDVDLPMPSRTRFSNLSQVDSDLALARALQDQERAFMMLSINGVDGSDYVSSEEDELEAAEQNDDEQGSVEGSDYGEDASDFNDDEAYARALQDAEERGVAARLMDLATGFNDWGIVEHVGHGSHSQEAWEEVDPDELSYEELVALGEVVGTESRGLSIDSIASLPSISFKGIIGGEDTNSEQCVICRLEYEDGDSLVVLSCKHRYHTECIRKWLQINKVCPICSAEVLTSGGSQSEV